MGVAKHGVSKHPLYIRWNGMIQRCFNPKDENYKSYGAKGISVDYEWDRRNPMGAFNFISWLEEQIKKLPADKQNLEFSLVRHKLDQNFSPKNCFISTSDTIQEVWQRRCNTVLNFNLVVELRQFKKANEDVTLQAMCVLFDIANKYTLSRCLQGISWSNVDVVEPPVVIKKRNRRSTDKQSSTNLTQYEPRKETRTDCEGVS